MVTLVFVKNADLRQQHLKWEEPPLLEEPLLTPGYVLLFSQNLLLCLIFMYKPILKYFKSISNLVYTHTHRHTYTQRQTDKWRERERERERERD